MSKEWAEARSRAQPVEATMRKRRDEFEAPNIPDWADGSSQSGEADYEPDGFPDIGLEQVYKSRQADDEWPAATT